MILFSTLRRLYPRLNIVITVIILFVLPLLLEAFLQNLSSHGLLSSVPLLSGRVTLTSIQLIAVAAGLPAVYLLDWSLRQDASSTILTRSLQKGRYIAITPITLFASVLIMLSASVMINNITLFLAGVIVVLYLLTILIRVLFSVPRLPLEIPVVEKRAISGATADISLKTGSQACVRLHSMISSASTEVTIKPERFTLGEADIEFNLTITPTLAGPSRPQLWLSATDLWGFLRVNQVIEPVELYVIPRARYAEWLAMRYLEKTQTKGSVATTTPEAITIPSSGVEFLDSRDYQPGDELRRVDWKHTLKLNKLIMKEYMDVGQQSAVIGVNLSVNDAEEADKLAFDLITTSLTLAQEAIPTALAAYNYHEVVLTTPVINPREALKQALTLVKGIGCVEFACRFLQPADISQLRRNIVLLKQATSKPAQQLSNILDFEHRAMEEAAMNNPATLALSTVAKYAPSPAIIILVSQLNHDTEALTITTERLSKRGFTSIPVESARQPRRSVMFRR
ncbi:MAG TPA: DUF58 domain-containing protein [Dehalococcoidia bacterium]|nr:DUF58 domain-containing protein [Dehalococcoidia bacterium]